MDVLTTILYPGAFFVKRNHIVKFLDSRVEIIVKKILENQGMENFYTIL